MTPVVRSGLKDSLVVKSKIIIPNEENLLETKPDEVEVIIPVEEFTESISSVRVIPLSNKSIYIKTFPESVEVSYWVALNDYRKVRPGMFRAVADIDSVLGNGTNKVQVRLEEAPELAKNIRISPEKVEFIIINQ
jgi:hypothetical protein